MLEIDCIALPLSQDTSHAVDVNVSVNMDGVKVISTDGRVREAIHVYTLVHMSTILHLLPFSPAGDGSCSAPYSAEYGRN